MLPPGQELIKYHSQILKMTHPLERVTIYGDRDRIGVKKLGRRGRRQIGTKKKKTV